MTEPKKLSTTQLAKKRGMTANQLFADISAMGLTIKAADKWILTEAGKQLGLARKQKKQAIYQKYNFNLIKLADEEVLNLDDILPRLLLKFGVQAY